MATYFVGTCLDSLSPGPIGVTDDSGYVTLNRDFDSYVDAWIVDPADGQRKGVAALWFHVVASGAIVDPSTKDIISFHSPAGDVVAKLVGFSNGSKVVLSRWTGSAFEQVGTPVQIGQGALDIRVVIHPTAGRLELFVNGAYVLGAANIDTSAMGSIVRARLSTARQGGTDTYWSQVILATYNTIGHVVRRKAPSAPGAYSEWLGSFADVDDGVLNDTDAINTSTVGARSTFQGPAWPAVASGNVIKSIAVAARIRNDGGAIPTNARALLRLAGADHAAPSDLQINAGYIGAVTCFDRDPTTGAPWADISRINGEFGLQATT